MTQQLEAIYENGVLRPLGPLALSELQRVQIIVVDDMLDLAIDEDMLAFAKAEVAAAREVGDEGGRLDDGANAAQQPGRVLGELFAEEAHFAAVRPREPEEHAHGRRLAGAVRAERAEDAAARNQYVDAFDSLC